MVAKHKYQHGSKKITSWINFIYTSQEMIKLAWQQENPIMFIWMHDLPYNDSEPMASMHGHVNEWHDIKTKKKKR